MQPIPDTGLHVQETSNIPLVINPMKSFPLSIPRGVEIKSVCATSIWQQHAFPDHEYLCLLLNEPSIFLYEIRHGTGTETTSPLPFLSGVCNSHYGIQHTNDSVEHGSGVSLLFSCDDHLIILSSTEQKALATTAISLPPLTRGQPQQLDQLEPKSIFITDEDPTLFGEIDGESMGFCPLSGRLVHLHGNLLELRVDDFLSPPPS